MEHKADKDYVAIISLRKLPQYSKRSIAYFQSRGTHINASELPTLKQQGNGLKNLKND